MSRLCSRTGCGALHFIALFYIGLHRFVNIIVPYRIVSYCIVSYRTCCILSYCTTFCCIALHCIAQYLHVSAECTTNKYAADNCSAVNQTFLSWPAVQNLTECHAVLSNCSGHHADLVGQCVSTLKDLVGNEAVAGYHTTANNYTSPSEEYF